MRACVCSQNGIGDGLISLVLSENLRRAGWDVVTMHKCLGAFQRWFPQHTFEKYPEKCDESAFDQFFVFYTEDNPFSLQAMKSKKACVLYPYRKMVGRGDLPLEWGKPFVKSLAKACKEFGLPGVEDNGLHMEMELEKDPIQVVIHAVSSTVRKDWPIESFVAVARGLKKRGFKPLFVVGDAKEREKYLWLEEEFLLPEFQSLDAIAEAIAKSAYLIGVDSGFGHLASSMGVPTVIVARQKSQISFWRPGWTPGAVVTPGSWVPNLRGFRIRDRYWKSLVSAEDVLAAFDNLSCQQQNGHQRPL